MLEKFMEWSEFGLAYIQAWTAEQEAAEAAKAEAGGSADKAAEAEKKGPRVKGKQLDEAVRCSLAALSGLLQWQP